MCFFTAGMLADFLGRLSAETVAVMEVECRSRGDARCRFLSATPEILEKVYNEMTAGRSHAGGLRGSRGATLTPPRKHARDHGAPPPPPPAPTPPPRLSHAWGVAAEAAPC